MDYDTIDVQTRSLYRQGISAFGGISPACRIAPEKDSPVIVWDFHSLPVMVQMCFSFTLTDKDSHMRMCRHCKKAFVASKTDAVYGWYRYSIRFALPVYDDKTGKAAGHNIDSARKPVRHANDGRKYLYDILAIKKYPAAFSSPPHGDPARRAFYFIGRNFLYSKKRNGQPA